MEWNIMEPVGAFYALGDYIKDDYIPGDDCIEILDEMLDTLLNDDNRKSEAFRRRMAVEKIIETELIPLIKVTEDADILGKAIRLLANLTQPVDILTSTTTSNKSSSSNNNSQTPGAETGQGGEACSLLLSARNQCTDINFFKAMARHMKTLLHKDFLLPEEISCLNHCVLLMRNLMHMPPGSNQNEQTAITHQCLLSAFFMNEIDKLIVCMLKHKLKAEWTISISQLISFIFKYYSKSLLEPDIDDTSSASSDDETQDPVELLTPESEERKPADGKLNTNFKNKLRIRSSCGSAQSSEEDDLMLEFKSMDDGYLEIRVTSSSSNSADDTEKGEAESTDKGQATRKGPKMEKRMTMHASTDSSPSTCDSNRELGMGSDEMSPEEANERDVMSSINSSSCLMDMDIFVSYLKKFATDIVYTGLVDLVENIMKVILNRHGTLLDHSFLMWTVGFFLSFAHQQELEFARFKELLNLDLFGFLVFEAVKACEKLAMNKQDCCVEKHRLHLVVCTLNQMFRTLLAHNKSQPVTDYLDTLQKCLSRMTDLRNLFVLLVRQHMVAQQSSVYLRDVIQTNHMLVLMLENWVACRFIEPEQFNMLDHIKQFATKGVMAKYGSLLERQELNKETANIAVLTMMYHVAGDCKRQDTLMQIPILKAFSEIWLDNAVREQVEFKDLIEFVLEVFMSEAEQDPNLCAQNLMDSSEASMPCRDDDCMSTSVPPPPMASAPASSWSQEEQVLVFSWVPELDALADRASIISRRLERVGFTKNRDQVLKFLSDSGLVEEPQQPTSTTCDDQIDEPQVTSTSSPSGDHSAGSISANNSISVSEARELSSLPVESLVPLLVERLGKQRLEGPLRWIQQQLMEAAYVKMAIKDPDIRCYVEEPVAKFYLLTNKSVPMVPWNEELQSALANPYFHLLLQSLGLYTCNDTSKLYPRIPHYLTPALLVQMARQIGSLENLPVKFNLGLIKNTPDLGFMRDDALMMGPPWQQQEPKAAGSGVPMKNLEYQWLSHVRKMNRQTDQRL